MPPAWVDRSAAAFPDEQLLNSMGGSGRKDGLPDLRQLHRALTITSLNTPALWLLAGSGDIQRIIEKWPPSASIDPLIHYELGVHHLADRQFGKAAEAFALSYSKERGDRLLLWAYSLGLAGRTAELWQLRESHAQDPGMKKIPPA